MVKKKSNPSPVTGQNVPPEITPPEIKDPSEMGSSPEPEGNSNPGAKPSNIIPTPAPVLSLEELNNQMAELRKAEAEREEREKAREEEHQKKMSELNAAIDNVSKENFVPAMNKIVNDVPTRLAYTAKAERMKQKLSKEAVKTIFIPKAPTEPEGIKFHVQLNGFVVEIPKDTYVDVPITIWQTIVDSQQQIAKAGEKYRLDLNGKSPRLEKNIDPTIPATPEV